MIYYRKRWCHVGSWDVQCVVHLYISSIFITFLKFNYAISSFYHNWGLSMENNKRKNRKELNFQFDTLLKLRRASTTWNAVHIWPFHIRRSKNMNVVFCKLKKPQKKWRIWSEWNLVLHEFLRENEPAGISNMEDIHECFCVNMFAFYLPHNRNILWKRLE